MGTNFFLRNRRKVTDQLLRELHENGPHIGKRSPAGWYCWDCKISLCKQGEEAVHFCESKWNDNCPKCGLPRPEIASLTTGAVAREIGLDDSDYAVKTGVNDCSSFRWNIDPDGEEWLKVIEKGGKPIVDEYGRLFSVEEFLEMLTECPIQYKDPTWYGSWFR